MKHKVIVAMSLVAAGVMTYLMFSGLDEGFYHFSNSFFTSETNFKHSRIIQDMIPNPANSSQGK